MTIEELIKAVKPKLNLNRIKKNRNQPITLKKVAVGVAVDKPSPTEFFRTLTGDKWEVIRVPAFTPDKQMYLVQSEEAEALITKTCGQLKIVDIRAYISHSTGDIKLDAIPQHIGMDGERNAWNVSHEKIMIMAETQWVAMFSERGLGKGSGMYKYRLPESPFPEPELPDVPDCIEKAIEMAFEDFIIDSIDHPKLLDLRGKLQ